MCTHYHTQASASHDSSVHSSLLWALRSLVCITLAWMRTQVIWLPSGRLVQVYSFSVLMHSNGSQQQREMAGTSAANLLWLWCNRKSFSIRDRKGQLELLFLGHLGLNQLLYFFKASALSLAKRERWLPSPTAARHPAGQQVEPYKLFCFRIQMHGALWNKEKNKNF